MRKSAAAGEFNGKKTISEAAIRDQVRRILESSVFLQSDRLGRFLRFTVEATLSGKSDGLKEYVIGTEVYDRKTPYDPKEDSIVRSEARRLRRKLKEYYESGGKDDPVFIYYRPGSYVPVFRLHNKVGGDAIGEQKRRSKLFIKGSGVYVAVLPFVDASHSPLSGPGAQLITDDLIHELVHTHGLRVTAATSVVPLVAQGLDIPSLAQKLAVQVLIEGTVLEDEKQLRITSRVVNAHGFQMWSERFEAKPDREGLFKVSESIASALISRIRPELSTIRKSKASAGQSIFTTYPTVLAAEALLNQGTLADTKAALAKFQEVAETEPGYARPFCGIAQCYWLMALLGIPNSAEAISRALEAAQRGAELDPGMTLVPLCKASALMLAWDWKQAAKYFEEALGRRENAGSYRQYALFLAALGRFDEAWEYLQNAQRIDAFSSGQKAVYAKLCYLSRSYEKGVKHISEDSVYGARPIECEVYAAMMLIALDRSNEARERAERLMSRAGAQPQIVSTIAEILAMCDQRTAASRIAGEYGLLSENSPISKFRQALLSIALGQSEEALSLLSVACEKHEAEMVWLARDPRLDGIRDDSRFATLLKKVMPATA